MKLRLEPQHMPTVLLSFIALLLIYQIGAELVRTRHASAPMLHSQQKSRGDNDLTIALKPEFVLPPLAQAYNEILNRPLFTSGRRPAPSPADAAHASSMQKGQFELIGVIMTGNKKIAMLNELATKKVFLVAEGKEINGMQLAKLEAQTATLKLGDDSEELHLKAQAGITQQQVARNPGNQAIPNQEAAASAVPFQANGRELSPAMQELIARRRAAHRNRQRGN